MDRALTAAARAAVSRDLPVVAASVALTLLGGACAAPPHASQSAPPVLPEPATRTVSFTVTEGTRLALDVSPGGGTIVFDLLGQLWTIPSAGGPATPLTDAVADAAEDLNPAYSPDGRWIAFQGDRGGREGLWVMPAGGGEPRLLTGTEPGGKVYGSYLPPAWSPDGARIAFGLAGRIHVHDVEADTTVPVDVSDPPGGPLVEPAWLPDGRILARVRPRGPGDSGGPLIAIDAGTGEATEVATAGLPVLAPSSPDGRTLAFFAEDDDGSVQLWSHSFDDDADGLPMRLTRHDDVAPTRPGWTGDGRELIYSADGRLWRVAAGGGDPREIPFSATVAFEREEARPTPLRFPDPGEVVPARGHMALALSPDASRIALLALGRLLVWSIGDEPRAVTEVPATAEWLSWSPAGEELAWSAGRVGAEDVFVTHVVTGATRRVTDLAGRADRPTWSPDGEHIAFYYWPGMTDPGAPAPGGRFAVIPAGPGVVDDPSTLVFPAGDHRVQLWGFGTDGQERPVWSPGSDGLIMPQQAGQEKVFPLEGEPLPFQGLEPRVAFLHWAPDSTVTYLRGGQLWRASVRDGVVGEPVLLGDDAALYPSVAADGTVLFVGVDGLRIRRPDGETEALGWPLTYRVPDPQPVLIRHARIVDGSGAPPAGPSDLLLEDGRIARITAAGTLTPPPDAAVLDAAGRTLIPGLIDLHQHGWEEDDVVYAASLYHGATTIREMGGDIARNAATADAAAAGVIPGPRVVLGGFQIYPAGSFGGSGAGIQTPADPDEGDRTLALAQAFGASYAKMRMPGRWSAGADLVRTANARGMRIGGHCAHPLPLIAAGIAQVQHVSACQPRSAATPRDDLVQLYRAGDLAAVPTMATLVGLREVMRRGDDLLADPDIGPFVTPQFRLWGAYYGEFDDDAIAGFSESIRRHRRSVRVLADAGIRLGTGTDIPTVPGAIHLELEALVEAGLTPLEALTAATGLAAKVLGAEQEIGTIAVGKRADLVLLEADPLDDIRNTRRIHTVILGGQVVDRDGLREWAEAVEDD